MRTVARPVRSMTFAARGFVAFTVVALVVVVIPTAWATTGDLQLTTDTTLDNDQHGSIVIVADNVTLDCAGHAVVGAGEGIGIDVIADDVTVTNCVVEGFPTAIFTGAKGTRVLGNTLDHNGEGLRLQGATDASVVGNAADANDLWGILACCNANNNTISGNTARLNRVVGMGLNGASSNQFTENVSAHNGSGFGIGFSSDFNTISHNVATNNAHTGFDFLIANNNVIERNVSVHNGSGPNGGGYAFNDSSGNTVTSNIAMNDGSSGFNVFFSSELNLFTGNHACKNFFGDSFDSSIGAGNTWTDDHFCNSSLP